MLSKYYYRFKEYFSPIQPKIYLPQLLNGLAEGRSFYDKIIALKLLVAWIGRPINEDNYDLTSSRNLRLSYLIHILKAQPNWNLNLSKVLREIVAKTDALPLLVETGFPKEDNFFAELINRSFQSLLPRKEVETDLSEVLVQIFPDTEDTNWLRAIPSETKVEILKLFSPDAMDEKLGIDFLKEEFKRPCFQAFLILSSFCSSIGLRPEFRDRLKNIGESLENSPFLDLAVIFKHNSMNEEAVLPTIQKCQESVINVLKNVGDTGASLSFTYKLELLDQYLKRLRKIYKYLYLASQEDNKKSSWTFIAELINEGHSADGVFALIGDNVKIVSKKIIEKTKEYGEEQIAYDASQYWKTFKVSFGGGVLVGCATIVKWMINSLASLPPFSMGLLHWLNYSTCFIWMQAHHFILATKQPSVTAAALSAKIQDDESFLENEENLSALASETINIIKTQLTSVIGNLISVAISITAIFYLYKYFYGQNMFPDTHIEKTIKYLHPWKSLAIFYGACMGFFLWISSLLAGTMESWWGFRNIKRSVMESHLLQQYFGKERASQFAEWLENNIGGIAGNISLGFFLAFTGIFGDFFGLPVEVRHVTLSTGAYVMAILMAPMEVLQSPDFIWSGISIIFIGFMNIGVSFSLALFVALRAKDISFKATYLLSKLVIKKLLGFK